MNLSPVTDKEISYVLENLSQQSKDEMEFFNLTKEDIRTRFKSLLICQSIWVDGQCCVLMGLESISKGVYRSHDLMIEGISRRAWIQITKFYYQFTNDFVKRADAIIISFTLFGGEVAQRWFSRMGFEYVGQDGNIHEYIKRG